MPLHLPKSIDRSAKGMPLPRVAVHILGGQGNDSPQIKRGRRKQSNILAHFETTLRDTETHSGEGQALDLEVAHHAEQGAVDLADDVGARHSHIVEATHRKCEMRGAVRYGASCKKVQSIG